MGFFKEMKDLNKQSKEMQKETGYKRPSITEAMRQGNAAIAGVREQQATAQNLMASGLDGQATISQLRSTGKTVNYMPEVELDMSVTVGGASAYDAHCTQVVAPTSIPQIQPGMTVPVKVDPANSAQIYLMVG
jgi:hypothetical protein